MRIEAPSHAQEPGLAIPLQIRPSQQSVLDQLHNHVAFTEALILLCGPRGAGKSSVLEVFLEQASDYANLAFIPAPANLSIETLRSKLLRQLVTLDAFAADDSLLEALQRNIKPGRQHLIIAIDEAAAMPPTLLAELQELTASRHLFNPEHRISVILAGDDHWAGRVTKGMKLGSARSDQEPPVRVEVRPFTPRECLWFARKLADTQKTPLSDERIKSLLSDTLGYPGDIQRKLAGILLPANSTTPAEDNADDEPVRPPRQQDNSRLVITLVVVAALASLAIGVALNWPDTDSAAGQPSAVVVAEPAATEEPIQPDDTSAGTPVVMDFNQAMNRLREAAQERGTEPDELIEQLVEPVEYLRQNPLPERQEPPASGASSPYDHTELLNREPDRVVLQVAALNDPARLDTFLTEFEHPQQRIYQTRRQGTLWYIVVVGDFSSVAEARSYLDNAGSNLQALQAWPKSIAAVQQEIAASTPDGGA